MQSIKLTSYSHGAGCGCKLSPEVLDRVLAGHNNDNSLFTGLLVGNDRRDDAAALELPNQEILLATTDFFMPIVDDPFDFGRIAATNAISDIYAMGGRPVMALAILGWPVDKLSPEIASQVLSGAREICRLAQIPIAGGHSIDAPEPIFGLAVNGMVKKINLKTNAGARPGDVLYLTKPLGTGLITTAEKKGLAKEQDRLRALQSMTTLNKMGAELGTVSAIHAMTDVTGFGLLGHLKELCEASNVSAEINASQIPYLADLSYYTKEKSFPGGTKRNWQSYGKYVEMANHFDHEELKLILCDPQTSGGLLLAVSSEAGKEVEAMIAGSEFPECAIRIGKLKSAENQFKIIVN